MVVIGELFVGDCRSMAEVQDSSIHLIVTSPPYWHLKDYSVQGQIGYGQSLHEYLTDLFRVWKECLRVLKPGRRLCINIGDQFARASVYGRYKIIPLHAEVISQCEQLGFDFMGSIIWQKKTTMRTTGGAPIMGSYPYPPNGLPEFDYEHILIFKKPGSEPKAKVSPEVKARSKLTKDEWKEHFNGHWRFAGARKLGHEAIFPEELPRRLIRMFTFHGETVLDPFLGSGTTMKASIDLGRVPIGYEINEDYLKVVMEKLGTAFDAVKIVKRKDNAPLMTVDYTPRIQDAMPILNPEEEGKSAPVLEKVIKILDERTLELASGRIVGLLGIKVPPKNKKMVLSYLQQKLRMKKVIVRDDGDPAEGYVYLKNKIFINAYLIRSGLAVIDKTRDFSMKARFLKLKKA
jgi:DNA modification methylase